MHSTRRVVVSHSHTGDDTQVVRLVHQETASLLSTLVLCASLTSPPALLAELAEPSQEERPKLGYWSVAEPRWFLATKSDLGLPYLRPYFAFGYGLPHWIWTSIDVSFLVTPEFSQLYAGVRAATPLLDVSTGVRDTWSFGKPLLPVRASYSRADVLDSPGANARYWAWELEAHGAVPLPYVAVIADFIVVRTLDVPRRRALYDESYRLIVADPLFLVLRAAPVLRLLREESLKIGILGEYLFSSGRGQSVARVGPVASLQLTDHLEALAGVTFNVSSPDQLGFVLSSFGIASLRYRWATGERRPELPWKGELIPFR
jgi:hypothetical protein